MPTNDWRTHARTLQRQLDTLKHDASDYQAEAELWKWKARELQKALQKRGCLVELTGESVLIGAQLAEKPAKRWWEVWK